MGLIANQMVIEMYYRMKQSIQSKKEQKKNRSQITKAEKNRGR